MEKIKIIAEIGWNHMGDMSLASKMIEAASKSGADICKFQTWSEKNLKEGPWDKDGRREIYKKAELDEQKHIFLKKTCEENNVEFLTSIFNINDLDLIKNLKMKEIKIPSHEVNNIKLIKETEKYFEKILVSTGAAKWDEIKKIFTEIKKEKIIPMHCVSSYPCDIEKINMKRLLALKELSNTVGYSGHLSGIEDSILAITYGATYIEKHFTIDNDLPGRDNKFAILPNTLKSLVDFRNKYNQMNIDLGLDLQECEMDTYKNYRGRWSKNA